MTTQTNIFEMTFAHKTSAVRAAKRELGDNFESLVDEIVETEGGRWVVTKNEMLTNDFEILRKSLVDSPCRLVFEIASKMHAESNGKVRRKDVIQKCVDLGVAYYTARTQYQNWYTANKNCA